MVEYGEGRGGKESSEESLRKWYSNRERLIKEPAKEIFWRRQFKAKGLAHKKSL